MVFTFPSSLLLLLLQFVRSPAVPMANDGSSISDLVPILSEFGSGCLMFLWPSSVEEAMLYMDLVEADNIIVVFDDAAANVSHLLRSNANCKVYVEDPAKLLDLLPTLTEEQEVDAGAVGVFQSLIWFMPWDEDVISEFALALAFI